jgi:hypothetical protein
MKKIQQLVTELQHSLVLAWVMVILAALALLMIFLEWWFELSPELIIWFREIDLIIAYFFLADFFAGLFFNVAYRSKWLYFKDNWLNLVSSVPITSEITSVLRVLRLIRAIRIIRGVRAGMNFTFAKLRKDQVEHF